MFEIIFANVYAQEEALKSIALGKDVFVILPTSYGKLLIYAVLLTPMTLCLVSLCATKDLLMFNIGCEGSIVIAQMVDQSEI